MSTILEMATDLCFWGTLIFVAVGFGGRMATGQIVLVTGASLTALCWMAYLLVTAKSRYDWIGCEWLWGLGLLVGIAQLVPLPERILLKISPQLSEILPLWFDSDQVDRLMGSWKQLSLNPWETASGLATFASYLILFFVLVQRVRTIQDVEKQMCFVSISSIAMMAFAQLQLFTSNSKFFWVYEHPYMSTDSYPLGCFTNRNHLAQFLALGVAPSIWWLLRRLQQQETDRANRRAMPTAMHATAVIFLMVSLCGIALTVLMTLSRGGLMAIGLASLVSTALMCRIGLASMKFGLSLLLVGSITSGLFSYLGYESTLTSRLQQNSGRSAIWEANYKVAREFPVLGTGIGTHIDAYHLQIGERGTEGLEYTHAESGYLQVASESGIAGLVTAGLFILTCLWWCAGALRSSDTRYSSIAVAALGSLIANVSHAVSDFFWYTPVCMLLLAVQMACAARIYRLTRQERGVVPFSIPLPRLAIAVLVLAIVPLSGWMFSIKYPALLAEPHYIESLLLTRMDQRGLTDEERASNIQQRLKSTIQAAKLDVRNATFQENAARAYIQLFDLKQEHSENTMSADMIRDAVIGSQFPSMSDTNAWLDRAVGSNLKLLRLASKCVRRSLANCPIRAKSYVLLTEVNFIERKYDEQLQKACLTQALKLRPTDPDMQYLVGKSTLLEGNLEKALVYWRPSFEHSARNREKIADILAAQMSPEFFYEEFHPDWKALNVIAMAFERAGKHSEARQVRCEYIRNGVSKAKNIKSDSEFEAEMISLRNACRAIGDIAASANVLSRAVKRVPQSYSVRYMLGLDLTESGQTALAAEHLKWCATRNPKDQNLQKMASVAVVEQLKKSPSSVHRDENIEQAGFER